MTALAEIEVIEQPDVEAWVWQHLKHLPGVTSFAFTAIPDHPWQSERGPWTVTTSIQVSCRAKRKAAARNLANQALRAVTGLLSIPWPDGVITRAVVTEGPFWLPSDDGDPHYVTRWEIGSHPRPAPGHP